MRKVLYIVLFVILLVVAFLLLRESLPKQSGWVPFVFLLFLLDFYLWHSIRKDIKSIKKVWMHLITAIYWLPFLALTGMGIGMLIKPIMTWPPALSIYLFGLAFVVYISKLLTVFFILIADLIRILRFSIKFVRAKKNGRPFRQEATLMSRSKFLKTMGLASGGVLLSGLLVGVIKWAYDFRVRREYLKIPGLPEAFNGLKIVQISDLHLGSWISSGPLDEAVSIINSVEPDLVFFTGDLVNSTTTEAVKFRDSLQAIRAKKGIFAVLGNHDYGDYVNWPTPEDKELNLQMLYKFYKRLGWNLLNNKNYVLEEDGGSIAIVGVENWSKYERFPSHGDIKKALKGAEGIPVKILLSHDPTHWEQVISKDHPEINLTLSGHTHGFQFGVELKGFRWSLAQYMYKYWAGLYSRETGNGLQHLYVNRGLGMVGYPGRVGILPEITLITLEA